MLLKYFFWNKNFRPFPEETILPSKLPNREEPDDDIYLNLREQYEQQQQQYTEFDNYSVINKQREEEEERTGQEIYESICSQKIPRNRCLPLVWSFFEIFLEIFLRGGTLRLEFFKLGSGLFWSYRPGSTSGSWNNEAQKCLGLVTWKPRFLG